MSSIRNMAFQMPPALAGDNAEVSFDGDGAKNWAMVAGGLTAFGLAAAAASRATSSILESATGNGSSGFTMEVQ